MSTQSGYTFVTPEEWDNWMNQLAAENNSDMHNHVQPAGFAEHNDIVCILRLRVHRSDTNNVASRNSLPDWRWVAWTVASATPRSLTTT